MLWIANEQGVLESDREFFNMMTNDLEALDNFLLESNGEIAIILDQLLRQEVQCSLAGYIENSYINGSIKWWKNSYLPNIKQRKLKYISEVDIADFVNFAQDEIVKEINMLIY